MLFFPYITVEIFLCVHVTFPIFTTFVLYNHILVCIPTNLLWMPLFLLMMILLLALVVLSLKLLRSTLLLHHHYSLVHFILHTCMDIHTLVLYITWMMFLLHTVLLLCSLPCFGVLPPYGAPPSFSTLASMIVPRSRAIVMRLRTGSLTLVLLNFNNERTR